MRTKEKSIAIVLGGGKGTRLYPLTMDRAKPAVPFAGKYRLVDIPISNCINSGIRQIYILTQFNSASLHNHIANTYIFDTFSNGFVEILAAEQTNQTDTWYQGTADAVRKNLRHFHDQNADYYIILSGDQLYRMDLKEMLDRHISSGAELTIAAKPISREQATGLGIIGCDNDGMITKFYEKPAKDLDISEYKVADSFMHASLGKHVDASNEYLASMGIYIFNAKSMEEVLNNDKTDFGKEIIPDVIKHRKVATYLFDGFWEDIGTIKAFYETNLDLASINPQFNFYNEMMPIYTHLRHLPATKVNFCNISSSLPVKARSSPMHTSSTPSSASEPSLNRVFPLDGGILHGASYYETEAEKAANAKKGYPTSALEGGTIIRKAIIDQNARIGDGCRIGIDDIPRQEGDFAMYSIHDGIIVINKNAVIKNGTVM